jgi:hypothetical protein
MGDTIRPTNRFSVKIIKTEIELNNKQVIRNEKLVVIRLRF